MSWRVSYREYQHKTSSPLAREGVLPVFLDNTEQNLTLLSCGNIVKQQTTGRRSLDETLRDDYHFSVALSNVQQYNTKSLENQNVIDKTITCLEKDCARNNNLNHPLDTTNFLYIKTTICGRVLFNLIYLFIISMLITPALVSCAHPLASFNWKNEDEIWFAQSAPFTGSSSSIGRELRTGILAAFNEINSIGGVLGKKKLRLMSADDGYEPVNTVVNFKNFLNGNRTIFGFLGASGSPTIQAAYDIIVSSGLPLIGSYTGATFLRQPFRSNIVNIRPSYFDETAAVMDVLISNNMVRKISVLYQDDPFGLNGFQGVERVLNYLGIPMCSSGSYQRNTLDVQDAFEKIAKCDPDAIVIIALYAPAVKFIRMVSNSSLYRNNVLFAATSIASDLIVRELGFELASRVLFSQVAPSPTDTSSALVRSFINARKALDSNFTQGTFIEIEGYMAGKLTYHLLQRIIGDLTPQNFLTNLYYSQEVIFDNLKLGPFSSATVLDPIYNIQSNISSEIDCNQGSKSVWRAKADSSLHFYDYQPPFSWYSSGSCLSNPESVTNPILLAQLVHTNLGASNDLLTIGISSAISSTPFKGRPIHLLTRTYSDLTSLISTAKDLIDNYYVTAIVGSSGFGEAISTNNASIHEFREFFKTNYPNVPLIGSVMDNPSIMSTTGSFFIPSMINIRSTIIEEIGSLLKYAFQRGHTRISIVNCPSYTHINHLLKLLMDQLKLSIESEHSCSENVRFNTTNDNPHVVLVACASTVLPNTLLRLDSQSNMRKDGFFFVLEEKKKLVLSSSAMVGVKRTIFYSSSFPGTTSENVAIVSRFKAIQPPIADLNRYFISDLALEGFFIGEFVRAVLDSVADSAPVLSGQVFLDYIYNSQQIVVRDQKYGYFNRDPKRTLCNIGLRERFLFQINNSTTSLVSTTNFEQHSCCLQSVLEDSTTLNFRRPFQFVRLKPDSIERLTAEPVDELAKGVISNVNYVNSMGKYPYEFQFLTQTYNSSSNVVGLVNELVTKQQIFGIIAPDLDDYYEFSSIGVPIIGPKTGISLYRNYERNIFNIFPGLVDEVFNLVEYFKRFGEEITILYEVEHDSKVQESVLKRIIQIIANRQLKITVDCLKCVENVQGSVIIMAETKDVSSFVIRNPKLNRIGLMSETYEHHEEISKVLLLHPNVFISTIISLTSEHTGYVESEFQKQFETYFPNDIPTIESVDGFISFSFVEKVFESFLDRILPTQQQAFIDKVHSLSLLDIGDITFGKFTETCNQGTRRLYVSKFTYNNVTAMTTHTVPDSLFTFTTCGYDFPSPAMMDYLYYVIISILSIVFLVVAIIISGLLIYRQYKSKKSHIHAPKGGTIAFAFTDIQNSTVLWQSNEKVMKGALAIHNKIVRDNIKKFKGYEVKTQGDSFFVAFRRIDDCINWAFSVQSDLLKAAWPSDIITQYDCRPEFEDGTKVLIYSGLRVRMGLHCGHAEYIFDKTVKRPDYFGNTINQTARIQSLARGGEILCSEAMLHDSRHLFKLIGPTFDDDTTTFSLMLPRRSSETTLSKKRRSVVTGTTPMYSAEDFGYCSLKGIKEEIRVFTLKNNDMKLRVFPPVGKLKNIEDMSTMTVQSNMSAPTLETNSVGGDDFIVQIPDQASDMELRKKNEPIELPEIVISHIV